MKTLVTFAGAILFALLLGLSPTTQIAEAAVSAPSVSSPLHDAKNRTAVEKVHGCHRRPRLGPWTGLRHRHVGPFCKWKKVGNACKRWRRICRERCYDARRPGRCRIRCFGNNAPGWC